MKIYSKSKNFIEVPWKWNETHVDALLKDSEASDEVRNKNIVAFFKDGLKVTGFGEGNILKVINKGFDSVPKILRMTKADFLTVPNFKEKITTITFEVALL